MEFDGTTFALEIINFLVLVWLLQHFLYKPVMTAIAQRQAGIEKILADAQATRSAADALKLQYENRTAEWEQEKADARRQLQQEMERSKLTKTAMARKMETSRRQLDRVLNPEDGNVTLETLQRAANAVGRSLRLELT